MKTIPCVIDNKYFSDNAYTVVDEALALSFFNYGTSTVTINRTWILPPTPEGSIVPALQLGVDSPYTIQGTFEINFSPGGRNNLVMSEFKAKKSC